MSHELAFVNNQVCMAYLEGDEAPWHAKETNPNTFPAGAPISQIAEAAGLNYRVALYPNHRVDGSRIDDSHYIAIDDGTPQGGDITGPYVVAGPYNEATGQYKHYTPVQPEQTQELAEILQDRHGFKIITAGGLFNRAVCFIQCLGEDTFTLPGHDKVKSSLLITTDFTGVAANKIVACDTRVVCDNTRQAALSEGDIIKHDHKTPFDLEALEAAIGLNRESFGDYAEAAAAMARTALNTPGALEFFRTVFGGKQRIGDNGKVIDSVAVRRAMAFHTGQEFRALGKDTPPSEVAAAVDDRIAQISRNVKTGLPSDIVADPDSTINPGHDLESSRGTLWGAYNTVTWLADKRPTKSKGIQHQISSQLMGTGTGGAIKRKAYKEALALIDAA